MKVIRKSTGEETTAVYATTPTGNKRYNVDGKFYTDKKFDETFIICLHSPKKENLSWRVNTPGLFKEITSCGGPSVGILRIPLQIMAYLLIEVGQRASELNDPKLNALMCRLAIYEISDPYNPAYDEKLNEETIKKGGY